MRIDVLNTMMVLLLRYLYSVKSHWQENCCIRARRHIPVQRICALLTPQSALNINLGKRNFHRAENSGVPSNQQIWCF